MLIHMQRTWSFLPTNFWIKKAKNDQLAFEAASILTCTDALRMCITGSWHSKQHQYWHALMPSECASMEVGIRSSVNTDMHWRPPNVHHSCLPHVSTNYFAYLIRNVAHRSQKCISGQCKINIFIKLRSHLSVQASQRIKEQCVTSYFDT